MSRYESVIISRSAPAGMYLLQSFPTGKSNQKHLLRIRALNLRLVLRVHYQFTPRRSRVGILPTVNNLGHGDAIVAELLTPVIATPAVVEPES